jgi:hypothetical protein
MRKLGQRNFFSGNTERVFLLQSVYGEKSIREMHGEIISYFAPNHFQPPLLYSAGNKWSISRSTNDMYTLYERKRKGVGTGVELFLNVCATGRKFGLKTQKCQLNVCTVYVQCTVPPPPAAEFCAVLASNFLQ